MTFTKYVLLMMLATLMYEFGFWALDVPIDLPLYRKLLGAVCFIVVQLITIELVRHFKD